MSAETPRTGPYVPVGPGERPIVEPVVPAVHEPASEPTPPEPVLDATPAGPPAGETSVVGEAVPAAPLAPTAPIDTADAAARAEILARLAEEVPGGAERTVERPHAGEATPEAGAERPPTVTEAPRTVVETPHVAHASGHAHEPKKKWRDMSPRERIKTVGKNAVAGGLVSGLVGAALYEPYAILNWIGLGKAVSAPLTAALHTGSLFAITGGLAATIIGSYFLLSVAADLIKETWSYGMKMLGGVLGSAPGSKAKKADSHAAPAKKTDDHGGGGHATPAH
jgi:hypothetical protein